MRWICHLYTRGGGGQFLKRACIFTWKSPNFSFEKKKAFEKEGQYVPYSLNTRIFTTRATKVRRGRSGVAHTHTHIIITSISRGFFGFSFLPDHRIMKSVFPLTGWKGASFRPCTLCYSYMCMCNEQATIYCLYTVLGLRGISIFPNCVYYFLWKINF